MPPEGPNPEDPREWLRRARSNLARSAQEPIGPEVLLEDMCFDAQQAAEKALKALIVLKGRQVPRTHAIAELITRLVEVNFDVPGGVQEASALTDYAVSSRYPGTSEPVLTEDHQNAVALARAVVEWVAGVLDKVGT